MLLSPQLLIRPISAPVVAAGASVAITFKDSGTKNTGTYDTSFTLTGKTLSTTGKNIVAVGAQTLNTGEWSTCTIDGVAATSVLTYTAPSTQRMALFVANSSGNAVGNIVFGLVSFGADAVAMINWGMTGAASSTPSATATQANLNSSVSLAIPTGGAAIGFQFGSNNGVSPTWTAMTGDASISADGTEFGNGGHTNTGGTQTVGVSVTGGTDAGNIFAAWGP